MIRKFCAERGCRRFLPIGTERCDEHARAATARRNRDRQERGLFSHGWRERRVRVLERDGYRCRLKLPGCMHRATEVHLDPAFKGDHTVATDEDCTAACQSCNVYERNHRQETGEKRTRNVHSGEGKELVFG